MNAKIQENPNLLSESPAMFGMSMINGSTEMGPFSVWDGEGDDMTMELLTDVDDGNIDEEASSHPMLYLHLS